MLFHLKVESCESDFCASQMKAAEFVMCRKTLFGLSQEPICYLCGSRLPLLKDKILNKSPSILATKHREGSFGYEEEYI
jgi:hypothetical protein